MEQCVFQNLCNIDLCFVVSAGWERHSGIYCDHEHYNFGIFILLSQVYFTYTHHCVYVSAPFKKKKAILVHTLLLLVASGESLMMCVRDSIFIIFNVVWCCLMLGTPWAPPIQPSLLCCVPCTHTSLLTVLTTGETHIQTLYKMSCFVMFVACNDAKSPRRWR